MTSSVAGKWLRGLSGTVDLSPPPLSFFINPSCLLFLHHQHPSRDPKTYSSSSSIHQNLPNLFNSLSNSLLNDALLLLELELKLTLLLLLPIYLPPPNPTLRLPRPLLLSQTSLNLQLTLLYNFKRSSNHLLSVLDAHFVPSQIVNQTPANQPHHLPSRTYSPL